MEQQAALREQNQMNSIEAAIEANIDINNDEEVIFGDEDDEELAMARQLEQSELKEEEDSVDGDEEQVQGENTKDDIDFYNNGNEGFDDHSPPESDDITTPDSPVKSVAVEDASDGNVVSPAVSRDQTDTLSSADEAIDSAVTTEVVSTETVSEASDKGKDVTADSTLAGSHDTNNDAGVTETTANAEADESEAKEEELSVKKPKNSAWQAMLQKEKESLAKQKRLQKKGGGLVEGEAEEEEEEEGIVGLEDFGFAVTKKKDDDGDEDLDVDEDDLEHVVDGKWLRRELMFLE